MNFIPGLVLAAGTEVLDYQMCLTLKQTTSGGRLTEFILQSVSTDETFQIKNALVVPEFPDDEGTLPHAVNVEKSEHFRKCDHSGNYST